MNEIVFWLLFGSLLSIIIIALTLKFTSMDYRKKMSTIKLIPEGTTDKKFKVVSISVIVIVAIFCLALAAYTRAEN